MRKEGLKANWKRLPHPIRWVVAATVGATLLALGFLFLFIPGPGLPLIIAGLAVLATEFAWAEVALHKTLNKTKSTLGKFKKAKSE